MRSAIPGAALALSLLTLGCAGPAAVARIDGPEAPPSRLPPAEQSRLDAALADMAAHDRANDWTAERCAEVAGRFAGIEGAPAAPLYNAGLARARCGQHEEARQLFQRAAERDPAFVPARVALARYATSGAELDRAIEDMQRVVSESRFTSVDALVALGELSMRRGRPGQAGGEGDLALAKRSFHRALAIDDGYMPALNQLAIYYLRTAKAAKGKPDAQALELAALVCSQAARKSARYAPIHNTAGLVYAELGDFSRAAAEFDRARAIDRTFFEAHMNVAAVNMAFRGFAEAERAYRDALSLRPGDYDARLGLALALRGQIDDRNEAAQVEAARREIAQAKAIAPERPEAYYNEAVLVQEFGAKGEDAGRRRAALLSARSLLGTFLSKAEGAPALADARRRASERVEEIGQIIGFLDPEAPASP